MPAAHAARSPFTRFLRDELTGGLLLVAATILALVWANALPGSYATTWSRHLQLGPDWLQLDLSLRHWATDGLLTVFFLVAGIEVKRELVDGELRSVRRAALPICAAVGGMLVPPLVAIAVSGGAAARDGVWAVPVATDIAFALGILALVSARIPTEVRILLLSLAVLDDIVAIALIALLFTAQIELPWLAGAAAGCVAWAILTRLSVPRERGIGRVVWMLALVACAVATWTALHASGVHATIAGVALGLLAPIPVGDGLQRRLHPFSAAICVPVFALAAAGIPLVALTKVPDEPLALAVAAGLLVGKPLGIGLGAWLAVRIGIAVLPARVSWTHVLALGLLGGIGYTVSLLIVQLTSSDTTFVDTMSAAVLAASTLAALAAIVLLRWTGRRARTSQRG